MKIYPKYTTPLMQILMPAASWFVNEIRSAGLSIGKGMYATENGFTVGREPEEGVRVELKTHTAIERVR